MVSAGNHKQDRLVTIVGTLREGSVNKPCRWVLVLSTNHAITGETP